MNSYGQVLSPRTTRWAAMHEVELAAEVLNRDRHTLDADEAEALATRHAEARRVQRQAAEAAWRAVGAAGR